LRTRLAAEAGRGPDRVPARDREEVRSLAVEANPVRVPEARGLSLVRDRSRGQRVQRLVTTKITANRGPEVGVNHQMVGALEAVHLVKAGLSRSLVHRVVVPALHPLTKMIARPTIQLMATTND
jgi:hypothetical protein